MCDFVHIHVHSQYSLLDGLGSPKALVEEAVMLKQPGIAITDHGNMHGVVEMYREAKSAGIIPIIGLEAYQCKFGSYMHEKDVANRDSRHCLLLAQDNEGYKNLIKLSSMAYTEGFYSKPRIDFEVLERYNKGLIATTGCMSAEIPRAILNDYNESYIHSIFEWYLDVFGPERLFVELQQHPGIPELPKLNKELIRYAKQYNLRMVATNDVHYATKFDAPSHEILLCVQTKTNINNPSRFKFTDNEYYIKTRKEMESDFAAYDVDESIFNNTLLIMEMCSGVNVESDKSHHMPNIVINSKSYDEELRLVTYANVESIYGPDWKNNEELTTRIEYELDIIKQTGFAVYFLIIRDICEFARKHDIIWNVRGSGAGSVVGYIIGLSFIDPIKYHLVFERFLNPARVSTPDFDMDFPDNLREPIILYLIEKYGEDHVSQIVTFGRMRARMCIRDVARSMEKSQEWANKIAGLVLNTPGKPITIENSLDPQSEYYSASLRELYDNDEEVKEVLDIANSLEKTVRHTGIHAAAVAISDKPMIEYAPLMRGSKATFTKHVSQFDYPTLESLGLLKVDILGLATLSIVNKACEIIKERHGIDIKYEKIPFDTPDSEKAYELLRSGEVRGVFQVESSGLRKILLELQPTNFQQIMDVISLYRPGPMDYIPTYIRRSRGEEELSYIHEDLQDILNTTQAVCIYQEQIIRILRKMAGYSLGEADVVRKAISKKDIDKIAKERIRFIDAAQKQGYTEEDSVNVFNDIEKFALYGFNACIAGDETVYRNSDYGYKKATLREIYEMKNLEYAQEKNMTFLFHRYRRFGFGTCLSMDENMRLVKNKIVDLRFAGYKECFRVTTEGGRTITVTANHKFPTIDGERELSELSVGDGLLVKYKKIAKIDKIVSIESAGETDTYDVEVKAPYHNFVMQNGIITSNSHAASYARMTVVTAWLKANYPLEFIAACLIVDGNKPEKAIKYMVEARRMGISVLPPHINNSKIGFSIDNIDNSDKQVPLSKYEYAIDQNNVIRFGFGTISQIGEDIAAYLENIGPEIKNEDDLLKLDFGKINSRSLRRLAAANVFDGILQKNKIINNEEAIIDYAKVAKDVFYAGQTSLFVPELKLDANYNFNEYEEEKESLGLWLTKHPVLNYYNDYYDILTHNINDIEELEEGEYDGICALVLDKIKPYTSRSGKPMAFLGFSDVYGSIEGVIFGKAYEQCKDTIQEGKIYIVNCRISIKDSNTRSVVVQSMALDVSMAENNNIVTNYDPAKIIVHEVHLTTDLDKETLKEILAPTVIESTENLLIKLFNKQNQPVGKLAKKNAAITELSLKDIKGDYVVQRYTRI